MAIGISSKVAFATTKWYNLHVPTTGERATAGVVKSSGNALINEVRWFGKPDQVVVVTWGRNVDGGEDVTNKEEIKGRGTVRNNYTHAANRYIGKQIQLVGKSKQWNDCDVEGNFTP